jgi:hypothetical protein
MQSATRQPSTPTGPPPDGSPAPVAHDYLAAAACFADDLEAMLAIHRVPTRHRVRVRTTNPAERSFEEDAAAPK